MNNQKFKCRICKQEYTKYKLYVSITDKNGNIKQFCNHDFCGKILLNVLDIQFCVSAITLCNC
jgi:hypothetical protein